MRIRGAWLLLFATMACTAFPETAFERKDWSITQDGITAELHATQFPGGHVEIRGQWHAQDGASLEMLQWQILDPAGKLVKQFDVASHAGYKNVHIISRAPSSKTADSTDWSIKEHGIIAETVEESQGLGWKIPLGKVSRAGDAGTNEDAMAMLLEVIDFDIPAGHKDLKDFQLVCLIARHGESIALKYQIS